MVNKHFLKTVLIFTGMIAIGLISIFFISYFNEGDDVENIANTVPVAK